MREDSTKRGSMCRTREGDTQSSWPTNTECLRKPIPEIYEAARYLDEAVSAYMAGQPSEAEEFIRQADIQAIRDWTESLWGKESLHLQYRLVPDAPPHLSKQRCAKSRMPTPADKAELLARDGYHCRFCGIPLIRREVRQRFRRSYPHIKIWGRRNADQHAAFQAMWVQFDHLLPHC
jgi:hypothetical protein